MAASRARTRDLKIIAGAGSQVQIPDPIFVLGHWRSGTTHLHNLLALDTRWTFPDFVCATQPHGFLSGGETIRKSKLMRALTPKNRLIDNMSASMESPVEDEVALTILSQLSPAMGFLFPKDAAEFDRYLSFQNASDAERKTWQASLRMLLLKLAIFNPKPAILKSPPHTARIRWIRNVFPRARFIHIHRNPYDVFASYKRSALIMLEMMRLQNVEWEDFDQRIISQYSHLYDAYFADKGSVPEGFLTEVGYEDLEANPIQTLEKIYQDLNLGDFDPARPAVIEYMNRLGSYRKSDLADISPELLARLNSSWDRSFRTWNYKKRSV
ncbi:MAG: sulfotransferase [Bdellovibrionaceae bacterium]|nr:sulfotransferase [Pseudobdellovibrionaceae bacterium]